MASDEYPAGKPAALADSEMQIVRAILTNCSALGVAPDEARRMAARSIVNLRRTEGTE